MIKKFIFFPLFLKFGLYFVAGFVNVLSVIQFLMQRYGILILHTFRLVNFYGFGSSCWRLISMLKFVS